MIPISQVDAFTDAPYKGNPAAVCVLPGPRDEAWMQAVAREMNLSETAFLLRRRDGWDLRWFTPVAEVDLCGHATLASAHALWEEGLLAPEETARFHTCSGLLTARRAGGLIELDFPSEPPSPIQPPPGLLAALGVEAAYTGRNRLDYLVEAGPEAEVRALRPDFALLAAALGADRGVIVTGPADSREYDFVSRYFAPTYGIPEDPVTGSAHCCLGPFWRDRLGRDELVGYQASERGGTVHVRVAGERVLLGGHAVTVLRGQLLR